MNIIVICHSSGLHVMDFTPAQPKIKDINELIESLIMRLTLHHPILLMVCKFIQNNPLILRASYNNVSALIQTDPCTYHGIPGLRYTSVPEDFQS